MVDLQISARETDLILQELAKIAELPGDVVEFGCYAGDTSVILAEALKSSPDKWLYLYDSFEGLPEKTAEDQSASGWRFKAGELRVSPETVAHKFKKHSLPEPVIVKKWFNRLEDSDLPSQIGTRTESWRFHPLTAELSWAISERTTHPPTSGRSCTGRS